MTNDLLSKDFWQKTLELLRKNILVITITILNKNIYVMIKKLMIDAKSMMRYF